MHYVETYNASKAISAHRTTRTIPAMLLMIDYGVFYEFIPLEDVGKENPRICCLEEVELNKNYCNGHLHFCRTVAVYDWGYREVHQ